MALRFWRHPGLPPLVEDVIITALLRLILHNFFLARNREDPLEVAAILPPVLVAVDVVELGDVQRVLRIGVHLRDLALEVDR